MDWEESGTSFMRANNLRVLRCDEEICQFKVHNDDVHSILVELSRDGNKVWL